MDLDGVGADAPTVKSAQGGKASKVRARMDLLPPAALYELAVLIKEGAEKYGEWDWLGVSIPEQLNHSMIHWVAYMAGDTQEGQLGHLLRHACRSLFALELALRERAALNKSTTTTG